jgi:hypothetical protein
VKKRSKTARRSLTPKSARQIRTDLATELYSLVRRALQDFGVSAAEQRGVIKRLPYLKGAPRVSGPMLRDTRNLGALLLEWTRDVKYLDKDGKPKVLSIRGLGSTFESLAGRFLPYKKLDDVVSMACETAEVVKRPGGKIALLGGIMVNVMHSPERSLAFAVTQVDKLLKTSVHNWLMHTRGRTADRMQRLAIGLIPRAQFDPFMRELRPQIYDLLLRADSSFINNQPKSARARRGASAVSVGVYVSEEDDLVRAGVDANAPRLKRQKVKRRK